MRSDLPASTDTAADQLSTMPREAKRLGVGPRVLRRAAAAGEFPVYDVGGWPRVRPSDVDRWLASRRRIG